MCNTCGRLSLHIPLARSSVTSAPVQTATMNYCIELTRQVSNLFETKSSNRIEMFFGPSLSRDLCHLFPYDGTQSREEEKGFSWFSCLMKFPMPWFRHTPNVYVNFHYSDNRFWLIYRFSNSAPFAQDEDLFRVNFKTTRKKHFMKTKRQILYWNVFAYMHHLVIKAKEKIIELSINISSASDFQLISSVSLLHYLLFTAWESLQF